MPMRECIIFLISFFHFISILKLISFFRILQKVQAVFQNCVQHLTIQIEKDDWVLPSIESL